MHFYKAFEAKLKRAKPLHMQNSGAQFLRWQIKRFILAHGGLLCAGNHTNASRIYDLWLRIMFGRFSKSENLEKIRVTINPTSFSVLARTRREKLLACRRAVLVYNSPNKISKFSVFSVHCNALANFRRIVDMLKF